MVTPSPVSERWLRATGHQLAAGELAAWGAAVEHLHAAALPAVPEFPAAWLRRQGIYPDWVVGA